MKRKMKQGHVSGIVFCSLVDKSLEKCQAIQTIHPVSQSKHASHLVKVNENKHIISLQFNVSLGF